MLSFFLPLLFKGEEAALCFPMPKIELLCKVDFFLPTSASAPASAAAVLHRRKEEEPRTFLQQRKEKEEEEEKANFARLQFPTFRIKYDAFFCCWLNYASAGCLMHLGVAVQEELSFFLFCLSVGMKM